MNAKRAIRFEVVGRLWSRSNLLNELVKDSLNSFELEFVLALKGHPVSGLPLSLLGTSWCMKVLLGVVDRVMEPPSSSTTIAMELSVNTARTKVD